MKNHEITLCGEKVRLRPFGEEDLDNAFLWNNHPAVLMAEGQESHTREEVVDAYNLLSESGYVFVIEVGGEPIGDICLTWMGPDELEIGCDEKALCVPILIGDPKNWGKGYGRDSLRTLIQYAFRELKPDCIWAVDVPAFNLRSVSLLQSLGFKEIRRSRQSLVFDGEAHDTVDLRLRREDLQWEEAELDSHVGSLL
jgi:RimJ/RimL family protein N-acetyltransferase